MDEARRCTAKSVRSGQRCKKAAILGGVVCQTHGGGAPQVKKAARERLNDLIDPAINELGRRVEDSENPALALRAAQDILDRAGYKSPEKVELNTTEREFVAASGSTRKASRRCWSATPNRRHSNEHQDHDDDHTALWNRSLRRRFAVEGLEGGLGLRRITGTYVHGGIECRP